MSAPSSGKSWLELISSSIVSVFWSVLKLNCKDKYALKVWSQCVPEADKDIETKHVLFVIISLV